MPRGFAAVIAGLLLLAQIFAAAHVHPDAFRRIVVDGTQVNLSEAACPVCLFHFHSPTTANPVPSLARPLLNENIIVAAAHSRLLCCAKPQLFGRAPPAAA
jgi:hypothetical protein